MSALSHQSGVNTIRNFWLDSDAGTTIPFATPLNFGITAGGDVARIIGNQSTLFIQSPTSIAFSGIAQSPGIKTEINIDADQTNQLPGIYVSSSVSVDAFLQTNGYVNTYQNIVSRDTNNNVQGVFAETSGKLSGNGLYPSTIQGISYFPPTALGTEIYRIDPTIQQITIPSYSVSSPTIYVSSINGNSYPSGTRVIEFSQPVCATQAYPQAVTAGATVTNAGISPGGLYSYDIGVTVISATPNNAGSAPSYPYMVLFGVRLGGNGAFDYAHTMVLESAVGAFSNGGYAFNLSGMTRAGTANQNIEVVVFQGQAGTTVSLQFSAANDPTSTLVRIA